MAPFVSPDDPDGNGLPWPDSAASWKSLLDELPVGVVVLDREGRVVAYNRAEARMAGTRPDDVLGREFFGEVAPCTEVRELAGAARRALADPDVDLDRELDFRFELDEGDQRDVRIRMRKMTLVGEPCVVLVVQDNTRLKETERSLQEALERAEELARTDPLTGLGNRRWFEERLRSEFHRAERYEHAVSLLVVDIDHFKDVNDRWGHAAGDAVLAALGDVIRRTLRGTDRAFRVGGEEFCLLLPHTSPGEAEAVAGRLHEAAADVTVEEAPGLDLTLSIGLAATQTPGQGPEERGEQLWRQADEALYRAKEAGRARTVAAGEEEDDGDRDPDGA